MSQLSTHADHEKQALLKQRMLVSSSASAWLDVSYYRLALTITSNPNYLSGNVTVGGICRQNNSQLLTLDLANAMQVDSVRVDGTLCTFTQGSSAFSIQLPRLYQSGEAVTAVIHYRGTPIATGFGSFVFTQHLGVPWIYSLSEPYGASDWWPCKNTLADKADSVELLVTVNSNFKVGSQGRLLSVVNNGNGTSTHHWKSLYPIAPYLVSVAISDYVQFSNWFKYSPADSMEILNYVLPEHLAEAQRELPKTVDMMRIFTELFGSYPFLKEKYGHAEYTGGGMEHQTMTSLGRYREDIIAHELAHQWFGDMITCRTWSDLWLNEGFAEYATGLYLERQYGAASYRTYMDEIMNAALNAKGRLGAPDTSNLSSLFNFSLMYAKGGTVLHMLRHVLGDSLFFRSMKSYAEQPQLKYSSASTNDLIAVCESVANRELDFFFQEWIYGEHIPTYFYSWTWNGAGDTAKLTITVQQPSGRTNPSFFTMPLDFRIKTESIDTTVTLFNNSLEQKFTIPLRQRPLLVRLDPDNWVLKRAISGNDNLPSDYILEQNYPNPFNSGTHILYILPHEQEVTLTIYDILGREVTTLVNERQIPGIYEVPWSAVGIASGVYFYRLAAGDVRLQRRMVVVK